MSPELETAFSRLPLIRGFLESAFALQHGIRHTQRRLEIPADCVEFNDLAPSLILPLLIDAEETAGQLAMARIVRSPGQRLEDPNGRYHVPGAVLEGVEAARRHRMEPAKGMGLSDTSYMHLVIQANEAFDEFIAGVSQPATMAELAAAFQRTTAIPDDYRDAALSASIKQDLRRAVNRYRLSDGTPRLISLPDVDPDTGLHVRRYKQLDLFNREDYVKAWWLYDAHEQTCRKRKHGLERHHDGRGIDAEPLLKIVLRGDAGQGAA